MDFGRFTETRISKSALVGQADALLEDDMGASDLGLYVIVFCVAVAICTFAAMSFGVTFGPMVLIPSMGIGFGTVAILAARLSKHRHTREATVRAHRQVIADAEMARKVKEMKRDRFEKGL